MVGGVVHVDWEMPVRHPSEDVKNGYKLIWCSKWRSGLKITKCIFF